jgi:hypothetical protein
VFVGTLGSFRELPGLRMLKNNSGCRYVVHRIVLADESILAHRRSVMRSSKHSELRWRETFSSRMPGLRRTGFATLACGPCLRTPVLPFVIL